MSPVCGIALGRTNIKGIFVGDNCTFGILIPNHTEEPPPLFFGLTTHLQHQNKIQPAYEGGRICGWNATSTGFEFKLALLVLRVMSSNCWALHRYYTFKILVWVRPQCPFPSESYIYFPFKPGILPSSVPFLFFYVHIAIHLHSFCLHIKYQM